MGLLKDIATKILKPKEDDGDKLIDALLNPAVSNKRFIYDDTWLNGIAEANGYIITDNENAKNKILEKLTQKCGHCPCGGMTEVSVCPCKLMREYGACRCGLFIDKELNTRSVKSSGKIHN